MKYLFLDTESGGLSSECSLLELCLMVTDNGFNIIETLDLQLIPDNRIIVAEPEGLSVTNIDLRTWGDSAVTYKVAKTQIYNFLQRHSMGGRLVPVGHGVQGDINLILKNLISKGSWDQFCQAVSIDTCMLAKVLQSLSIIEPSGLSLSTLCSYFGIELVGYHRAMVDTIATRLLYLKLIRGINSGI